MITKFKLDNPLQGEVPALCDILLIISLIEKSMQTVSHDGLG